MAHHGDTHSGGDNYRSLYHHESTLDGKDIVDGNGFSSSETFTERGRKNTKKAFSNKIDTYYR